MIRTLIIDDEIEARTALATTLSQFCPLIEVIGQGFNGKSGLDLIKQLKPELVFLDVEMPDLSGFDLLHQLEKIDFAIIFITAFNQYAVRAFEFSAVDYLLKPIDPPRLIRAIEKVKVYQTNKQTKEQYKLLLEIMQSKKVASLDNRITFSTQEAVIFVMLKDLIRIEADQNCSSVFVKGLPKKIFIAKHLKAYERLFQDIPFLFRVHRSHIVNLYHVKKFLREDGGYLLVTSHNNNAKEERIPVSNRIRDDLLVRLNNL